MQPAGKRLAARRATAGLAALIQGSATTQMTAFRLARRERPRPANAALQSLERACHSLRTAPCLGRSGKLCIPSYHLDGVLEPVGLRINWLRKWESGSNIPGFSLRRPTMRLKTGNICALTLPRYNTPKPDRLLASLGPVSLRPRASEF